MRPTLSRSLQAFGLALTLMGLVFGMTEHSMTLELSGLLIGTSCFMVGQALARGRG